MEYEGYGWLSEVISWALSSVPQFSTWQGLQALAALGGLAFGIYRWWYAAERNMHKRLAEYLTREDHRLAQARQNVLQALDRPDLRSRHARAPLLALPELRRVLKRADWETVGANDRVEREIEHHLATAVSKLEKHIAVARAHIDNYRNQLADAHVIHAAVSAAKAHSAWSPRNRIENDLEALNAIRLALQIPGFANELTARRLEAHQLRRLGHLPEALKCYETVERLAQSLADDRERNLTIADAKRWRGAILQAQQLNQFDTIGGGPQGSWLARQLLKAADSNSEPGALDLRAGHAPFAAWDAIDQADMHYLTAYLDYLLGNWIKCSQQLDDAISAYGTVLRQTRGLGRVASRKAWKLRKAAKDGLKRVKRAKDTDVFDERWLLPPATPLDDGITSA